MALAEPAVVVRAVLPCLPRFGRAVPLPCHYWGASTTREYVCPICHIFSTLSSQEWGYSGEAGGLVDTLVTLGSQTCALPDDARGSAYKLV